VAGAGLTPLPGPQLPWPDNRRPLSVVTLGNSTPSLMLPPRKDRAEGTYTEVLADLLAGHGVPAIPHTDSEWFGFLKKSLRAYALRVRAFSPDVLIVQFGINELQPWLAPIWLLKHLMTQGEATTRSARAYRRFLAPRLWKGVRGYRRRVAPVVGMRTWQTTPRRFRKALLRLLTQSRLDGRPLVLVLDIEAPGEVLHHFLPGIDKRHRVYQQLLEDVVAEFDDPEVRLVRVTEVLAEHGGASPDGMHYTADGHRAIGERLAQEVVEWLSERGKR
jgi:lysophospholipase L1-like esterase